jgi:hypothetical protein
MEEKSIHLASHQDIDYQPLIDELGIWQGIFELAFDEASKYLDQEQFPARELQASLTDMCDLLRAVLLNSRPCSQPLLEVRHDNS